MVTSRSGKLCRLFRSSKINMDKVSRKTFLRQSTALLAGSSLLMGACASEAKTEKQSGPQIISGKAIKWKMCTTWPAGFPVLGEGAVKFAEMVNMMSGGRLTIEVYGDKELVPAFELFDAVSVGAIEMGSGASYYWAGRVPKAQFFATVPFGMNAQMMNSWLLCGGGQEMWDKVYEPFDLKAFPGGNTGVQMGGWFNREIKTLDDLQGLKMRIPGLGGKVMSRAGVTAMAVAGSEVFTNLERGVLDATEWIGPYHDYLMGFHKIAQYYYYPGWHEPGTTLELIVNRRLYQELPQDLQQIVAMAAQWINVWTLSEFEARNAEYLQKILSEANVQLKAFPKAITDQLRIYTEEVVQEPADSDAEARQIYDSYRDFQTKGLAWSKLTERAYFNYIRPEA